MAMRRSNVRETTSIPTITKFDANMVLALVFVVREIKGDPLRKTSSWYARWMR